MTTTLKFTCSRDDQGLIQAIVDRAIKVAKGKNQKLDPFRLMMDITATHCNGNPLKLKELANANEFEFIHDVWGIMRHIDRSSGKMEDCFLPRFVNLEAQKAFHLAATKAS